MHRSCDLNSPLRRPSRWVLALATALILGSPLVGAATGIGSYRMFSEPVEYRLTLGALNEAQVKTPFPLQGLDRHLSRDARRVVLPAHRFVVGETNAQLLEAGLPDILSLVCELRTDAVTTEARLERRALGTSRIDIVEAQQRCAR